MRFPIRVDSVSQARHFVRHALSVCPMQTVEIAELLTSELATNAVLHGCTPFDVIVSRGSEALRVGVRDDSDRMPVSGPKETWDIHGRGLSMLEWLSDRWGMQENSPGKTVWFDLRLSRAPAPSVPDGRPGRLHPR